MPLPLRAARGRDSAWCFGAGELSRDAAERCRRGHEDTGRTGCWCAGWRRLLLHRAFLTNKLSLAGEGQALCSLYIPHQAKVLPFLKEERKEEKN